MTKLVADLLVITRPIWSVDAVDSDSGELVQSVLEPALVVATCIEHSARGESDELMHVVGEEFLIKFCKRVKELYRALRHAEIVDFVSARVFLDSLNIGNVIIDAHLSPGPCPVLGLVRGETGVLLRVLRAAIVAEPDVVAVRSKLQRHGNAIVNFFVVGDPDCCVF